MNIRKTCTAAALGVGLAVTGATALATSASAAGAEATTTTLSVDGRIDNFTIQLANGEGPADVKVPLEATVRARATGDPITGNPTGSVTFRKSGVAIKTVNNSTSGVFIGPKKVVLETCQTTFKAVYNGLQDVYGTSSDTVVVNLKGGTCKDEPTPTTTSTGTPSATGTSTGTPSATGTSTGTPSTTGTSTGTPSTTGTSTSTPTSSEDCDETCTEEDCAEVCALVCDEVCLKGVQVSNEAWASSQTFVYVLSAAPTTVSGGTSGGSSGTSGGSSGGSGSSGGTSGGSGSTSISLGYTG